MYLNKEGKRFSSVCNIDEGQAVGKAIIERERDGEGWEGGNN